MKFIRKKKKRYPTNPIGTKFTEHEEDIYSMRDLLESEEKLEKWKIRQIYLYGGKLGQKKIDKTLVLIQKLKSNPGTAFPGSKATPIKGDELRKCITFFAEVWHKKIEEAGLDNSKESECITRLYQVLGQFQEKLNLQDDQYYNAETTVYIYTLMFNEAMKNAGVDLGGVKPKESTFSKNSESTFVLKSSISEGKIRKIYECMVDPSTNYEIFRKLFSGVPVEEVQGKIKFTVTLQEVFYMLSKLKLDKETKYQSKFEKCECLSNRGSVISASQIREASRSVRNLERKYEMLDLIFSNPIEKNMG